MIYWNEIEPYAAAWLRNLIAAGHLPAGEVDTRSIVDVQPDDLRGFTQCHFFAGIGGWSLAARLAGWPDGRPLWTGSCPCQPFSIAGRGTGASDERHLWPAFFRLITARRPPVVMGEQVAAAIGKDWLDGVCADLEGIGYACGAAVAPACAVDAPHRRDRLWFVANTDVDGCEARLGSEFTTPPARPNFGHPGDGLRVSEAVANASGEGLPHAEQPGGRQPVETAGHEWEATAERGGRGAVEYASLGRYGDAIQEVSARRNSPINHDRERTWDFAEWIAGADGKARRVKPGVRLLAHGVPGRVGRLRAYGNAIVPQVAAEVIAAFMECQP